MTNAALTPKERARALLRADIRGWLQVVAIWSLIALVVTLLATFAPSANAATVGLHLATAHFGGHDLRASTPGLYIRAENGFTAGTYRNSYDRTSTYAGWTWQTDDQRLALTVGAVTGYDAARVMPLLVPSARVPLGAGFAARFSFIPKPVKSGHAAGLHLSLETSF